MKKYESILALVLCFIFCLAFNARQISGDKWTFLFNEKNLKGWDVFLGPKQDESGNKSKEKPFGLNNDPAHVFSVVDLDGEKVIRVSGEIFGAITTKNEYENYHLQLFFKWGSLTWGPKKNKKKDSGLLYHAVGKQGSADGGYWMRSQEFQIEETNCGDYWGVAGAVEDIPAIKKSDSEYFYNPAGQWYTFSADNSTGRHCIKDGDSENPSGRWNQLDLYVHGDTSVHVINGKRMMVLYHSRQTENGKLIPLVKGKLQLQSEGAEVFYKQIKIKTLNSIPKEWLNTQ
jgi:hypothetical protein